jgi:FtsZ-interacting cell division protein YlmF
MMARLNMGDASAEQLQAVAETLNRQAAAKQQQSTQQQPASSRSMASSAASGDPSHQQQQQQQQEASRLARRQRAAAVVSVDHLQAPRALSIAGWEPMSTTDVQRCRATFQNKVAGGRVRH